MMSEAMKLCADMILTDAIEDLAKEENLSIHNARKRLLESSACESLYDAETELWQEGPDYFRDFYQTTIKS